MKRSIFTYLFLLCLTFISAQTKNVISGVVYNDADKSPLPGATVQLKNSFNGTVTNFEGEFQLSIENNKTEDLILVVSFIGMQAQEITLKGRTNFVIYLKDNARELEQVIVTSSYGTKKLKEEVVGSISTIGANDIPVTQASESIDKMLDGQIAGVLMETSSTINGPVKIDIRGQGSLSTTGSKGTSTQPLIIIDGIIMDEEIGIDNSFFDGNGTFSEDFQNPLAQISPDDIETYTVLKDAAAVGIYGADGANGVILITTKKGRKGKMNISFSTQVGISQAINRIQYMNGEQYHELRNEYNKNSGLSTSSYNGINTDWYNLLNQDGSFQRYNISINGGVKNVTYRSSLNYVTIGEPQQGNSSRQYRMSNNLGYKNKKFSVDLSFNPSYLDKDQPNIYYAYAFAPNISPYNEDGSYSKIGVVGLSNPLAAIEQNLNNTKTFGLLTSLSTQYKIISSWNISSTFGLDYKDKNQDRYFSASNESGQMNGTFEYGGEKYPRWGRRLINQRNSLRWNWQTQTSYKKRIGRHHTIDALLGIELAEGKATFDYASGLGFVNPEVLNPVEAALRDDDPLTEKDETYDGQNYKDDINYNSRVSSFGQLNYDYKKKYFLLVNIRRDQSSVFGDDVDVALNSGAGLSWIISKENFLKDINIIDFLRLRISYGKTGNSRIGSYTSAGIYSTDNISGYYDLPYAYPTSAPNSFLTWETNYKFNTGIDINFLNRFKMVAEYFYDDIRDMITSRPVPSEIGFSTAQINGANMYNKGLELSLNTEVIKTNNVQWTINLNFSSLKNKITHIVGLGDTYSISSQALAVKEGSSTTDIWGVQWLGIDPATGRNLVMKDNQIYDYTTYNQLFESSDWDIIGNSMPEFYGGFRSSLSLMKRISFSFSGRFKYGQDKIVEDELISKYNITSNRNLSVNAIDYWKEPGDIALLPAVSSTAPVVSNLSNYLYDASHIKINSINLSYRVPLGRYHKYIKHLSVYANVSNAFYFYFNKSPEGRNGIREFMYNYPEARTWTMGIKANL